MNTMTLVHTTEETSLLTMSDEDLEAWFGDAGLPVEAVESCDTASCFTCSPPAKAA